MCSFWWSTIICHKCPVNECENVNTSCSSEAFSSAQNSEKSLGGRVPSDPWLVRRGFIIPTQEPNPRLNLWPWPLGLRLRFCAVKCVLRECVDFVVPTYEIEASCYGHRFARSASECYSSRVVSWLQLRCTITAWCCRSRCNGRMQHTITDEGKCCFHDVLPLFQVLLSRCTVAVSSVAFTSKWSKIDLYSLRRKCIPKNVVFSDISFMAICTEVTENERIIHRHLRGIHPLLDYDASESQCMISIWLK